MIQTSRLDAKSPPHLSNAALAIGRTALTPFRHLGGIAKLAMLKIWVGLTRWRSDRWSLKLGQAMTDRRIGDGYKLGQISELGARLKADPASTNSEPLRRQLRSAQRELANHTLTVELPLIGAEEEHVLARVAFQRAQQAERASRRAVERLTPNGWVDWVRSGLVYVAYGWLMYLWNPFGWW